MAFGRGRAVRSLPFPLPYMPVKLGPWLIRIFDIGRGGGGNGVASHVFVITKALGCKKTRFIALTAYRRHIRWAQLEEDSRNTAPDVWAKSVNDVISHQLMIRSDFAHASDSPGYGEWCLEKFRIPGGKVGNPAPNQIPPMNPARVI